METTEYTYQSNCYFGVFYPIDYVDIVFETLSKHSKFAGLATDEAEAFIGADKLVLFASTNSDIDGDSTLGFVASDDMTFGGPDQIRPEDCSVRLEPVEMEKREAKYADSVKAITDIYQILLVEFKKRKITGLYHGWNSLTCTWDLDTESASSSSVEIKKKTPIKSTPIKAQNNQPSGRAQNKGQKNPRGNRRD